MARRQFTSGLAGKVGVCHTQPMSPLDTPLQRAARTSAIAFNVLAPFLAVGCFLTGHPWFGSEFIAFAHGAWMIPTLWPQCAWYGQVVTSFPPTPHVWLTIDDGPDPIDTPLLLDILDAHQARATFFFIGEKAAAHPALVREVAARGHTIGNHTTSHPHFWFWAYGPRAIRREVQGTQRILAEILGHAPTMFRAPVGFKSPLLQRQIDRDGLALICWSARGFDGVSANVETVLKHLRAQIQPGAIILMHEGREDDTGQRLGPQVLEQLLAELAHRGLQPHLPDPTFSRLTPHATCPSSPPLSETAGLR